MRKLYSVKTIVNKIQTQIDAQNWDLFCQMEILWVLEYFTEVRYSPRIRGGLQVKLPEIGTEVGNTRVPKP